MLNHIPGEGGGPISFSSKITEILYCYKIKYKNADFLVVNL